jgi:magnesium chelatase family protein
MARVPAVELVGARTTESSAVVAGRIATVRAAQVRGRGLSARLTGRRLHAAAALGPTARDRLVALAEMEGMSARGMDRLLRVARTIADLAGSEAVAAQHLEEAARYRRPAQHLADVRRAG